MSRHQRPFKSTQVFDWEAEPADERPTDFGRSTDFARSTSFSTLSGYLPPENGPAARRLQGARFGLFKLGAAAALFLALCTAAVFQIPHLLKG